MADTAAVGPDWGPLASRIRDEATDSWDDKVAVDRFRELGGHPGVPGPGHPGHATTGRALGAGRLRERLAGCRHDDLGTAQPPGPYHNVVPACRHRDRVAHLHRRGLLAGTRSSLVCRRRDR